MFRVSTLDGRRSGRGSGLLALVAAALMLASAGPAHATVRIQAHSDPASDSAEFLYRIQRPAPTAPVDFGLRDGQAANFGPFEGTVTVQALGPADWQVADIQCVGPRPGDFTIDLANETVTFPHQRSDEQTCSFTHRRRPAPGAPESGPILGQGIAPSPPATEFRSIVLPRRPSVLNIRGERGFVVVRVRLTKRSVVRAQLLWRGRVVGLARVVKGPGIYDVTPPLNRRTLHTLRHRGVKRVTVGLRVVVVQLPGATYVFRHGVRVRVK